MIKNKIFNQGIGITENGITHTEASVTVRDSTNP